MSSDATPRLGCLYYTQWQRAITPFPGVSVSLSLSGNYYTLTTREKHTQGLKQKKKRPMHKAGGPNTVASVDLLFFLSLSHESALPYSQNPNSTSLKRLLCSFHFNNRVLMRWFMQTYLLICLRYSHYHVSWPNTLTESLNQYHLCPIYLLETSVKPQHNLRFDKIRKFRRF